VTPYHGRKTSFPHLGILLNRTAPRGLVPNEIDPKTKVAQIPVGKWGWVGDFARVFLVDWLPHLKRKEKPKVFLEEGAERLQDLAAIHAGKPVPRVAMCR